MVIINFIKNTVNRTVESIREFKYTPLLSIGQIIPVVIGLTAFVGFVIAYVMFIANGGYVIQVNALKAEGFSGIEKIFTKGTSLFSFQSAIHIIVNVLLAMQFIVLLIVYFSEASIIRKIVTAFDLTVIILAIGIILVFNYVDLEKFKWFEGKYDDVAITIDRMNVSTIEFIALIVSLVAIVAIIAFVILVVNSDSDWLLGHGTVAALIAHAGAPLVLLALENIIPAVATAIFLLIVWIIIKVTFLGEKDGDASTDSSGGGSGFDKSERVPKEKEMPSKDKGSNKNCIYIEDLNKTLGIKLYKEKRATNTFIVSDNLVAQRKICTVKELEQGRFHIYDKATGREVKSNEIPWRKSTGGMYDS